MNDSYATPVLVVPNTDSVVLQRIPFVERPPSTGFDEKWLEEILFKHPKILPIVELDAAFSPLVPICRQLNVTGLSIDALFATPGGRLALLEGKRPTVHWIGEIPIC